MHHMIKRLHRRPRIVGASLTSATPGPGESAAVVGGRRSATVVRGSQIALGACLVAVLLAATSLTAGAAWGATGGLPGTGDKNFNPGPRFTDNHCVSPEGVDANQLLGISQPLFLPGVCGDVIKAGEFYVPLGPGWLTMNTFWETVPPDYTPSAPTPLEDFVSKVRSMIYVVDPGTNRQRTYRYIAQNIMDLHTLHDFFPKTGSDWPVALFLPKLPPLPPGDHHLSTSIEMSARSCNGLGSAPSDCLAAGITRLQVCPFKVVPRADARDARL
jgi:hypothetical protein